MGCPAKGSNRGDFNMVIKHKCIVCGRIFYDGQGYILSRGGMQLEFHSSKCLTKFFTRVFYDSSDISCLNETIKKLLKEYEELNEKRQKNIE
jgi:predicted  nucleic acid-binding Zn-ribbon protein